MKILKIFTMFLSIALAEAKVWDSHREWLPDDLLAYSKWVKTSLSQDIFSSPDSPYYGIETDCADAIYALLVIYSYENNLKIDFKLKSDLIISNNTDIFDNYTDIDKVKKFIQYIGKSSGTYSLANYNSIPVAIKDISAGDIYITSWINNNTRTNHAYIIKDILETGNFILYSSTTPSKVRTLNTRKGLPQHLIESQPWGFKRVIPYHLSSKVKELVSNEQYEILAKHMDDFFKVIRDMNAKVEDTINNFISDQLDNICFMLEGRIFEVDNAITYQSEINRCMTKSEYDLYSTPNRDGNIRAAMYRLMNGWKKIRKTTSQVSQENEIVLDFILGKSKSTDARDLVNSRCELTINSHTYNYRDYFIAMYYNRISSSPNDTIEARWGLARSTSRCQNF